MAQTMSVWISKQGSQGPCSVSVCLSPSLVKSSEAQITVSTLYLQHSAGGGGGTSGGRGGAGRAGRWRPRVWQARAVATWGAGPPPSVAAATTGHRMAWRRSAALRMASTRAHHQDALGAAPRSRSSPGSPSPAGRGREERLKGLGQRGHCSTLGAQETAGFCSQGDVENTKSAQSFPGLLRWQIQPAQPLLHQGARHLVQNLGPSRHD